jgi:flagellar hook-associated protein 3 FlgL
LQAANNLVGNTLDNVLTVRASVGSRLNELDTLNTQGDDLDTQYAASISNLQDLDYTKAITDLTKQKTMLEALQQSFVQISGLSLFKLL